MDIVFLARIHASVRARVTLRSVTRGRCWPLWLARVNEGEKEGGTEACGMYAYLREVNVNTFSAQIEYVPVSGVGTGDNLVSIYADLTSVAILSPGFLENF